MGLYVPIVLTISVVRVARDGGARVDENPGRRLCDPSPDTADAPDVRHVRAVTESTTTTCTKMMSYYKLFI